MAPVERDEAPAENEERSLLRRRAELLDQGRAAEGRLLDALSGVAAAWLELSELEATDRGLRRLGETHRLGREIRFPAFWTQMALEANDVRRSLEYLSSKLRQLRERHKALPPVAASERRRLGFNA